MTLTRKQAMCVLLGLPAAAQVAPKAAPPMGGVLGAGDMEISTITVTPMPKTATIALSLADKDGDDGGIDGITIHYHGQTRRITAAEIWEALDDGVTWARLDA